MTLSLLAMKCERRLAYLEMSHLANNFMTGKYWIVKQHDNLLNRINGFSKSFRKFWSPDPSTQPRNRFRQQEQWQCAKHLQ